MNVSPCLLIFTTPFLLIFVGGLYYWGHLHFSDWAMAYAEKRKGKKFPIDPDWINWAYPTAVLCLLICGVVLGSRTIKIVPCHGGEPVISTILLPCNCGSP